MKAHYDMKTLIASYDFFGGSLNINHGQKKPISLFTKHQRYVLIMTLLNTMEIRSGLVVTTHEPLVISNSNI